MLGKRELIALILAQQEQICQLSARVAELEARLNLPPKTPSISSPPPSKGHHIDLPEIKPVVTRVNIHSGACQHCGKRIAGSPPAGMLPGSPFGPVIAALTIYLHTRHMVSYNRLVEIFRGLFGLEISEGAIANIFSRASAPFAAEAGASMPKSAPRR